MRRGEVPNLPPPPSVADPRKLADLSPRERQVLSLAAAGHLDKQIAALLGVTLNTLRTYWTRIRGKLGETSRSALAALYAADVAAASALNPIEGANWHIDVARRRLVFYGDRDIFPHGELPLEQALLRYHPEDREKVGALLRHILERDAPPFTFAARVVTPDGVETASAYVETVRDETGRVVRIVGRHVPFLNLVGANAQKVGFGSYRRDLETGEFVVDAGFRAIFRLRPDEPELMKTASARVCPESLAVLREAIAMLVERGEGSGVLSAQLCFGRGDRLWITLRLRVERADGRAKTLVATLVAYE